MSGRDDQSGGADRNRNNDRNAAQHGGPAQPQAGNGGTAARGTGSNIDFEYYGKLGSATFGTFAFGLIVTWFLFLTFSSSDTTLGDTFVGGAGGGNELFAAATIGFVFLVLLGPLVALALGVLVDGRTDSTESSVQVGAACAGIGVGATFLVLLVLIVLLAPSSANVDAGQVLGPVIGATVGIAATGAGGGYLADELLAR